MDQPRNLNLPNALTVLRLALVAPIVAVTVRGTPAALAVGVGLFLVAGLTDLLDGWLARRRGQTTPFGTIVDPVADKVLMLSVFITLTVQGVVPLWATLVLLFRELLASAVRRYFAGQGVLIGANWMGKAKFCLLTGTVVLAYAEAIVLSRRGEPLDAARWTPVVAGVVAVLALILALRFLHMQLRAAAPPRQ